MPQPHRYPEVAGIPLQPALRASIGTVRSAQEDPPLAISATQRVFVALDRMTTESVIATRRGLLFLRARIHWPPSTLRRDRRDLLRSPAVLRPCLPAFAGSCWAPGYLEPASMCLASPFGHVSNSPPQPTGFCGCNWRANCRKSWRGARFSIRPVTH